LERFNERDSGLNIGTRSQESRCASSRLLGRPGASTIIPFESALPTLPVSSCPSVNLNVSAKAGGANAAAKASATSQNDNVRIMRVAWQMSRGNETDSLQRICRRQLSNRVKKRRMVAPDREVRWIESSQQRDPEAFEQLIASHQRMIHALTYRMTGSLDDAADLAQETFIQAFQQLGSFRADTQFSSSICRIAVNLRLNWRTRSGADSRRSKVLRFGSTPGSYRSPQRRPRSRQAISLGILTELVP
jgi:hypothetical protein